MDSYLVQKQLPDIQSFVDYPAAGEFTLPVVGVDPAFDIKHIFSLLQTPLFNKLIGKSLPEAYNVLEKLHILIQKPLREQEGWDVFYRNEIGNFPVLLQLLFAVSTEWGESPSYTVNEFINKEFTGEIRHFYGFDLRPMKIAMSKFQRIDELTYIIRFLSKRYWDSEYADRVAINLLASFIGRMDKSGAKKVFKPGKLMDEEREAQTVYIYQHSAILFWMSEWFGGRKSDRRFAEYFSLYYNYYAKSNYMNTSPPVNILDIGNACRLGLIPESEVRRELLTRPGAAESLHLASGLIYNYFSPTLSDKISMYDNDFSLLKRITKDVCEYILMRELNRDEFPTPLSHLAAKLQYVEGVEVFVYILKALGTEPFERLDYYYGTSYSKREVFSKLLRICYPSETDTPIHLRDLLSKTNIKTDRLLEAALYSPQWIDIIEDYIGWKGLLSGVCFFYAHIGVGSHERLKVLTARFSTISFDNLRCGAFDCVWYKEVFGRLGYKRFDMLTKAVACISSAPELARLGKYISALKGKEDISELISTIMLNRSKELLCAYCLTPFKEGSKREMLERYNYLLKFERESKIYGSQRQDNEKRAVLMALINLGRYAGYHPTRLVWIMETSRFKLIEAYFKPNVILGIKVYIKIVESGRPEIQYVKPGRGLLQSIPNKLRKDPYILLLRNTVKEINNYKFQSSAMLEQAMYESTEFKIKEWQLWCRHPYIYEWIKNIVVSTRDKETGFVTNDGLVDAQGRLRQFDAGERIFVIHPLELERRGELQAYRSYLSDNNLKQSVEQVERRFFSCREVPPLREEVPDNFPWQSDCNGGRFRVFHHMDIVVTLNSGKLTVSDRLSFKPVEIGNIPRIIFSEIMRDLYEFNLYLLD
jgi:hypothetical protein